MTDNKIAGPLRAAWHRRVQKKLRARFPNEYPHQTDPEYDAQSRTLNFEDLKKDWKLQEQHYPYPWFLKVVDVLQKYKNAVKDFPRKARRFIQRGRRGWSTRDAWNLSTYLTDIIVPACEQLRGGQGYPCDFDAPEEWEAILDAIVEGFKANQQLQGMAYAYDQDPDDERYTSEEWTAIRLERANALQAQYEKGMELFAKHFQDLWD